MNLLKMICISFAAIVACCPLGSILADSPTLDSSEAETVSYLREFSKYKWDIYRGSGEQMGPIPEEPILLALASDERLRMDALKDLLDFFGIADPVVSYEPWVYSDGFLNEDLEIRTYVGWGSRRGHFLNCAYLEEMMIRDLRQAIAETDESLLYERYMLMLERSYSHLVVLVRWLHDDPARYDAQLLEQADVDQIIADTPPLPIGDDFVINAGLNDAWFDPATGGQGFFISVYPETDTIILSWLTFDTETPAQHVNAHLGDPCQRWFTAQGHYQGAVAELVVFSSSGGIFNQAMPVPVLEEIGSISLEFQHCNHGTATYDLPGISASGVMPIQRVALDNVALCETLSTTTAR